MKMRHIGRERFGSSFQPPASSLQLLASVLAAVLTGCSANYNGERLLWKAQQLSGPIAKNPSQATPEQFARSVSAYERVIVKAPGTVWAGQAQMSLGSLYAVQKRYSTAREAYALVVQNYNAHQHLCLSARLATAKTYELERNWHEAIRMYQEIADYHPWSVPGLEAPLFLAHLYEQLKETSEATKAYERAVRSYQKLIVDAPSPERATQVRSYLALAYQRLARWNEAIQTLEELTNASQGTNRPLVLMTLGVIYQTKLNNVAKAEAAYTKLMEEFPAHPLSQAAKAQLQHLGLVPAQIPSPAPATP